MSEDIFRITSRDDIKPVSSRADQQQEKESEDSTDDTGPIHDAVATYVLACGLRNLKQVYDPAWPHAALPR